MNEGGRSSAGARGRRHGGGYAAVVLIVMAAFLLAARTARADGDEPSLANRVHMTAKPAVVKILTGHVATFSWKGFQKTEGSVASGSGFFINADGYVMTNAHVVDAIKKGDEAAKESLFESFVIDAMKASGAQLTKENFAAWRSNALRDGVSVTNLVRINRVFMQNGKWYAYEIKAFGNVVGQGSEQRTGKDVAVIKIEVKNAPVLLLGPSSEMKVGDPIWIMGYPGAADTDETKSLDEQSSYEPTTNDGKISALKTTSEGAPILQTNTNTTHGNSGGPAINDKGQVIGLLTFRGDRINQQEVQGFNFLFASDTAKEFVGQAGTENKLSDVDRKWSEALEFYWRHEYSKAKPLLESIKTLFPDHRPANDLLAECDREIALGHDRAGLGAGAWIGIVLGVLLVAGGVGGFLLFQKKQKPQAGMKVPPIVVSPPAGPFQTPLPGAPTQLASAAAAGYGPPSLPQAYGPVGSPYGPPPAMPMNPNLPLAKRGTEVFQATPGKLLCIAGPLQGREFPIGGGILIGREGPTVHLAVPDPQVSTEHVWVGPFNGRIIARDLGSTNGTYLNQQMAQRIQQVELNDSDVLTLGAKGTVRFAFRSL